MSNTEAPRNESQIVALLERVQLFHNLPRTDLRHIARLCTIRTASSGELLFREGDPGTSFYMICSGSVEIIKERPLGRHLRLAVRSTGDTFGEMALLTGEPRAATARALEETVLLSVLHEHFEKLIGGDSLAVRMLRGLAGNLYTMDERFVALDAMGSESEVMREFSRSIQRNLLPAIPPVLEGYQYFAGLVAEQGGYGVSVWDSVPQPSGGGLLSMFSVRGLGLPPGYLLGLSQALLREIADGEPEPSLLLKRLNSAMGRSLVDEIDECVETTVISLSTGIVTYCIAGEARALVLRAGGEAEKLVSHGPPIGILPQFQYDAGDLSLGAGDLLLVLSDGEPDLLDTAADLVQAQQGEPLEELAGSLKEAISKVLKSGGIRQETLFMLIKRVESP